MLKFGIYSSAFLLGTNLISLAIFGTDPDNFGWGEIFGYTVIVVSMGFVFLGIREYKIKKESLSFWNALKIGSLISILPSLVFGIYNLVYVKWIDPDFFEHYLKYQIDQMNNPTQEDMMALQAQMEPMANPIAMFVIMFLTVFLIGFIIAVISSIILKK